MTEEQGKTDNSAVHLTVQGEEAKVEDVPDIDIINRDPENINSHLQVEFGEIFAEPNPTIFSFDGVWRVSFKVFRLMKLWWYRILTLFCAVPLACCWAVIFAGISCQQIWVCVPAVRAFAICTQCMKGLFDSCMQAFVRPCLEALGYVFYNIRIKVEK